MIASHWGNARHLARRRPRLHAGRSARARARPARSSLHLAPGWPRRRAWRRHRLHVRRDVREHVPTERREGGGDRSRVRPQGQRSPVRMRLKRGCFCAGPESPSALPLATRQRLGSRRPELTGCPGAFGYAGVRSSWRPKGVLSATLGRHPRTTPLRPCRYAEQLEVAERRRNPEAYARKIARTERNRRRAAGQLHIPPRPLYTL